ncbi:MAG: hypothetical protein JO243_25010 [Solirubrobacterales bacterium]|nr:hypothetical protein [Solirubrobacterales bacterium]
MEIPFPGNVGTWRARTSATYQAPSAGYGAFQPDQEHGSLTVPLHRDDGKAAEFTVPDFVSDPEDLRAIAGIVTSALEKWEQVKGLGA